MQAAQPGEGAAAGQTRAAHLAPRRVLAELALVAIVTFAYFLTRGLIRDGYDEAVAHAEGLLALERWLHLDPEAAIQHFALQHAWLTDWANLFYLGAHLPVLVAVAVWLYWKHPSGYARFRDAFLLSAAMGLSVYVALPVAPPRYLPGFVDTLQAAGIGLDGSAVSLFYNPYAAMPSLHVGWATIAGVAVVRYAGPRWLKALGVVLPVLMALAVIVTGNHFLLDTVAGVLVAALALWLAEMWGRWLERRAAGKAVPGTVDTPEADEPVVVGVGGAAHTRDDERDGASS